MFELLPRSKLLYFKSFSYHTKNGECVRDEDEKFEMHPGEAYAQRLTLNRLEEIINRMRILEEQMERLSKLLTETLLKEENSKVLTPIKSQKIYGFEPEADVD